MNEYPENTLKMIRDNSNSKVASGLSDISNNLKRNVEKIRSDISALSEKYKNLRNNLSVANAQNKKNTEEYIANTGNHTASGFAMSKRMNNQNAFNKDMNNLEISEQSELSSLNKQIRDAYVDADTQRRKLITEENDKALEHYLKENERKENLVETKRMNDAKISEINNDIELSAAKDKREQGEYDLKMKYGDQMKQAEIGAKLADAEYTKAKTNTETARKALVEAQTVKAKSTPSGSSGVRIVSGSKMSAGDLAENIRKQIGKTRYSATGKQYYEIEPKKAYDLLMALKGQFGLSAQVVNDTAIYLGIQDYL